MRLILELDLNMVERICKKMHLTTKLFMVYIRIAILLQQLFSFFFTIFMLSQFLNGKPLAFIDYCTKKETTLRVGHFTTISDHFSANYINIFHKTGVQRNNMRCLTCLNLNWVKSYIMKHNFIHFQGFSNL